ncbi:MAG: hypothetical protein ACU0BF_09915 [Paracoccaceae bacterium]
MVSSSKILTVSYGTFSCTLEGFDDSFGAMKAIAEYFRDLAADDRYFGAEPPTPDADMLARIAEREVSRRVEAQMKDGGVRLRPAQIEAPRPGPAMPRPPEAAPMSGSTPDGVEAATASKAPSPEPDRTERPAARADDSVASKLARIRAAVGRVPAVPTREAFEEDEGDDARQSGARKDAGHAADATDTDAGDRATEDRSDGPGTAAEAEPAQQAPKVRVVRMKRDQLEEAQARHVVAPGDAAAEPENAVEERSGSDKSSAAKEAKAARRAKRRAAKAQAKEKVKGATRSKDGSGASDGTWDPAGSNRPKGAGTDKGSSQAANSDSDKPGAPKAGPGGTPADAADDLTRTWNRSAASPEGARTSPTTPRRPRTDEGRSEDHVTAPEHPEPQGRERIAPTPAADSKAGTEAQRSVEHGGVASGADKAASTESGAEAPEIEEAKAPVATTGPDRDTDARPEGASSPDKRATGDATDGPASPATRGTTERPLGLATLDGAAALGAGSATSTLSAPAEARLASALAEARRFGSEPRATAPDDANAEPIEVTARSASTARTNATGEAKSPDPRGSRGKDEAPTPSDQGRDAKDRQANAANRTSDAKTQDAARPRGRDEPARTATSAKPSPRAAKADDGSVDRLMARTGDAMDAPETSRRREAMRDIRAAVAATEADTSLRGDTKPDGAFRADLDAAVRGGAAAPAPLRLVASQRVDLPRSTGEAAKSDAPPAESPAPARGSFAAMVTEHDLDRLEDLYEAAAAHFATREGIDDFTRPMIFRKVREMHGHAQAREDELRAFGTILREGRVEKVAPGRFGVASGNRYLSRRRAG